MQPAWVDSLISRLKMSHILRREKKQPPQLRSQECTFMGYCKKPQLQKWVTKMLTRFINWKGCGTTALSGGGTLRGIVISVLWLLEIEFSLSDFLCQWCRCEEAAAVARSGVGLEERGNRWLCRNENTREPSPSSDVQLLALSNDLNAPFWVVTFSLLCRTWSFSFHHLKLCMQEN